MRDIQQSIQSGMQYSALRKHIQDNKSLLKASTEHGNALFHVCLLLGKEDFVVNFLNDLINDIQQQSQYVGCATLVTTMHFLLLKVNNQGHSALHIAANRGLVKIIEIVMFSSNDMTLISLALTHCNMHGNTIQHIVLKKIIEQNKLDISRRHKQKAYLKIYNLLKTATSADWLESTALHWYAFAQTHTERINDQLLVLLTRMTLDEINELILHPERQCKITELCAKMLKDTLMLQNNDGNSVIHLIAMSNQPELLKHAFEQASPGQISFALQMKNKNNKTLLITLYEHRYTKSHIIAILKFIHQRLTQQNYCTKVFLIFYASIVDFREYIEMTESIKFDSLRRLANDILYGYMQCTIKKVAQGKIKTSEMEQSVAQTLVDEAFIDSVPVEELLKMLSLENVDDEVQEDDTALLDMPEHIKQVYIDGKNPSDVLQSILNENTWSDKQLHALSLFNSQTTNHALTEAHAQRKQSSDNSAPSSTVTYYP